MRKRKIVVFITASLLLGVIAVNLVIARSRPVKIPRGARVIRCFCQRIGPTYCAAKQSALNECNSVLADSFYCTLQLCPPGE